MAGELKGQKIGPLPKTIFARPILARIKKSLFDILQNQLPNSRFLDLFSGSGTVGLEAISRGAGQVVFIDANPQCKKWIDSALHKMSGKNPRVFQNSRQQVYCANAMHGFAWLNQEFDIIFSGAPYVDQNKKALYFIQNLLHLIERDRILSARGWFIAQHQVKEPFQVPESWDFFRQNHYGDSTLSFFRLKPKTP